jgi:uncharacterized membrane protein YsdA (DUF1294 family)
LTNSKIKSEIKDFTTGNLTSHLVKFAVPVLLSHLMMVLLNTVDMIVVGQRLGEVGTSAVSIGGSVAMFVTMQLIRHKTKHVKFMLGIPLIIIAQIAIAFALSLI